MRASDRGGSLGESKTSRSIVVVVIAIPLQIIISWWMSTGGRDEREGVAQERNWYKIEMGNITGRGWSRSSMISSS